MLNAVIDFLNSINTWQFGIIFVITVLWYARRTLNFISGVQHERHMLIETIFWLLFMFILILGVLVYSNWFLCLIYR